MATHYHIQELTSGLRIRAQQDTPTWERLLVAGLMGMFVGVLSAAFLGSWWWTILSIVAAAAIYGTVRGKSAELQVTNVEFTTRRDPRVRTPRIVCTGDVRQIEFREGFNPGSGGLYAVTAHSTICLLSLLDFSATVEVIRAIENKFPGLAAGWRLGQSHNEQAAVGSAK
jgi:hypothetical protein